MVQVQVMYDIDDGRETAGHAVDEDEVLRNLFTNKTEYVDYYIKRGICKVVSVIIAPHD